MDVSKYFGSYKKSNLNYLIKLIKQYEKAIDKYTNYAKPFFKGSEDFNYMEYIQNCELNFDHMNPQDVFQYISPMYQNIPNWINPGTMINVIPPVNLASLAGICFTNIFNPNIAEDQYSGRLLTSELEVSKYLCDLIGWDWKNSHGIFTFGGKGTNLYATKIALNKADPSVIQQGISGKRYFMITSAKAHPCHYEVCNWLGIGENNCIEAPCDENDQIKMDVLEQIIQENIESGKIFLGYNINGCSTVEYAVDPIKRIFELNQKIIKKYNLSYSPHIHVDAVIGWVWLFFKKYDFNENCCHFDKTSIEKIKKLSKKVEEIKYADSIGVDFHKTGFCPYISSLFLIKDRNAYFNLNPKKNIAYENLNWGSFAPFETSLELTRSASGPISALISLKTLGIKGYCQLVGSLFSETEFFRKKLSLNSSIEIINKETEGLATLFIIKPAEYKNLDLQEILRLPLKEINKIKEYNIKYGNYIKHLSLQGKISFTYTSSRSYKIKGTDIKIGAIKAYPLSVFLNRSIIKKLIKEINLSISSFQTEENRIFSNNKDYIPDDMVYREK